MIPVPSYKIFDFLEWLCKSEIQLKAEDFENQMIFDYAKKFIEDDCDSTNLIGQENENTDRSATRLVESLKELNRKNHRFLPGWLNYSRRRKQGNYEAENFVQRYGNIETHGIFLFLANGACPTFFDEYSADLHSLTGDDLDIYHRKEDLERRASGYGILKEVKLLDEKYDYTKLPALVLWKHTLRNAVAIPLTGLSHENIFHIVSIVVEGIRRNRLLSDISEEAISWIKENVSNKQVDPGIKYEEILETLRSVGMDMEREKRTYENLGEEQLRSVFVTALNCKYKGCATRETSNGNGKTDILIREIDNSNQFIAELKFWKGPKAFDDAITQLLGYLTWGDTKCALVAFNRTKNTSQIRGKMHNIMTERPEHRRTISNLPTGDSRYIFVKNSDEGQEITITTHLYDIPSKD